MERDAEPRRMRAGAAQQLGGGGGRDPELARQIVERAAARHRDPHEQTQGRGVADKTERHRLLQDLGQLLGAVEREIADPMDAKGLADRRPRLDRMHEMDLGLRQ